MGDRSRGGEVSDTPIYIMPAEDASKEQREIVAAGNAAIHAVMIIAGHKQLCAACFCEFVSQILSEASDRMIHEDEHDAGHA